MCAAKLVASLREAQFSEHDNNDKATNSMERSPFREAVSRSGDKKFPALYGIWKFLTYLEEPAIL
jgi:hypothetical protein